MERQNDVTCLSHISTRSRLVHSCRCIYGQRWTKCFSLDNLFAAAIAAWKDPSRSDRSTPSKVHCAASQGQQNQDSEGDETEPNHESGSGASSGEEPFWIGGGASQEISDESENWRVTAYAFLLQCGRLNDVLDVDIPCTWKSKTPAEYKARRTETKSLICIFRLSRVLISSA